MKHEHILLLLISVGTISRRRVLVFLYSFFIFKSKFVKNRFFVDPLSRAQLSHDQKNPTRFAWEIIVVTYSI